MLILGGASDIGFAIADAYAQAGWSIVLAVRDVAAGERNAADLRTRHGGQASAAAFDVLALDRHAAFLDSLEALPDAVVSVVGLLGEQRRAEQDPDHAREILRTNFEGPALFLGLAADRMATRGAGLIVGVSSVAGERGRSSNYVYGSAKAGLTAFLSGLRARLKGSGVRVITVKPGFVATQMTAGMPLPKPLTAQPGEVARAVRRVEKGGSEVIYVRPVWRLIMTLIRFLPEPIFEKMKS
jgi:decaprenylphospho-beta-D-erythro-pentofuranosid-2-ulose 2-reductase